MKQSKDELRLGVLAEDHPVHLWVGLAACLAWPYYAGPHLAPPEFRDMAEQHPELVEPQNYDEPRA